LGREKLRHRRFARDSPARIFARAGAVHQPPGRLDIRRYIGQLVLDRLEFGNEAAELLPLLRVFQRCVEGALRNADRERGDRNPSAVENSQAVYESLASLTEKLRTREAAIREEHLAG